MVVDDRASPQRERRPHADSVEASAQQPRKLHNFQPCVAGRAWAKADVGKRVCRGAAASATARAACLACV